MLRIDAETYAALNGVTLPVKQAAVMKVLATAATPLPLELVASRLPEEEAFFEKMTALVWQMTETMFSGS